MLHLMIVDAHWFSLVLPLAMLLTVLIDLVWLQPCTESTNPAQVRKLRAAGLSSGSLQSLLLEGCSGVVSFGALPALRKLELTSRHVAIPDTVARLSALQKLVRVPVS